MRKLFAVLPVVLFATMSMLGQTATQHGFLLNWTPPVVGQGEPALAGYNVYRSVGGGTAQKLNTSLVTSATYLDPNADLTVGTTYSYDVTAVDVNGNESGASNIVTVTPGVLFVNPPAPSGCNGKQQ
jgi:hypothetical protein